MFQRIEKETDCKTKRGNVPETLRRQAEQKSGISLQDVVVHYNSPEPSRFQAFGYALGEDIYLAPGREKDLSHELWHVVQQKQGRVHPAQKLEGKNLNTDSKLEQEADRWQSMDSLRYPQRQETPCVQRLVLVGVGDDEEVVSLEQFMKELAKYCYSTKDKSIECVQRMLSDFTRMSQKIKNLHNDDEGISLCAVYSFDSYEDLFKKLLMKHNKVRTRLNVANVGQGDSSMLQLPYADVMIDMGDKNTAERAYCCKEIINKNEFEAILCNCITLLEWESFKKQMSALYEKYCALLMVIYRNSVFFPDFIDTPDGDLMINNYKIARDIYFNWSDSDYKNYFTAEEIEKDFWNWEPQNGNISLEDIRDFYIKQRRFCNMYIAVTSIYFTGTSEDKFLDKADIDCYIKCLEDIQEIYDDESNQSQLKRNIFFYVNPSISLEKQLSLTVNELSNSPEEAKEDTYFDKFKNIGYFFRALRGQRLAGDFIIPKCLNNAHGMGNEGANYVKEIMKEELNNRISQTFLVVQSIARAFESSFNQLFETCRILTENSAAAFYAENHSWKLDICNERENIEALEESAQPDVARLDNMYLEKNEIWEEICRKGTEEEFFTFIQVVYGRTKIRDTINKKYYEEGFLDKENVIITHNHADHHAGLNSNRILVMGLKKLAEQPNSYIPKLSEIGLNIVDGALDLPKKNEGKHDENYNSLMLYYDKGDCRIFFLGDSPLENLQSVRLPKQKKYHVLIFPHHGSVTANTKDMPIELFGLEKTFGIVSAGAGNKYGLPSNPNLSREKQYNDGSALRGLPIQDGTCIPVREFLQKEKKENNPNMRGLIYVRSTMNMGFWLDDEEDSRAPGYVVVDISDDGKSVVFYTKTWLTAESPKISSIDRFKQATRMAVAAADRKHFAEIIKKMGKSKVNEMVQERILEICRNNPNMYKTQIAENIGEIIVDEVHFEPTPSRVYNNIKILLKQGRLYQNGRYFECRDCEYYYQLKPIIKQKRMAGKSQGEIAEELNIPLDCADEVWNEIAEEEET